MPVPVCSPPHSSILGLRTARLYLSKNGLPHSNFLGYCPPLSVYLFWLQPAKRLSFQVTIRQILSLMAEVCHDYFYWLPSVKIYFTGYSINALSVLHSAMMMSFQVVVDRLYFSLDTFGHNLSFLVQSATLPMSWLHAATISVS